MRCFVPFVPFFCYQGFLSRTLTTHRTAGEGRVTTHRTAGEGRVTTHRTAGEGRVTTHRTAGEGRGAILFQSATSTRSRTLRHLFTTLNVRWLSHIFNRNACIYQIATRWGLPSYWITIWLIDDVILIFVYLHVELILGFVTSIWHEKPVDSNSHRRSSLYYKRTN